MNVQFCKVARIKPNLDKVLSLKSLEILASALVDDIDKLEFPESFKTPVKS